MLEHESDLLLSMGPPLMYHIPKMSYFPKKSSMRFTWILLVQNEIALKINKIIIKYFIKKLKKKCMNAST